MGYQFWDSQQQPFREVDRERLTQRPLEVGLVIGRVVARGLASDALLKDGACGRSFVLVLIAGHVRRNGRVENVSALHGAEGSLGNM